MTLSDRDVLTDKEIALIFTVAEPLGAESRSATQVNKSYRKALERVKKELSVQDPDADDDDNDDDLTDRELARILTLVEFLGGKVPSALSVNRRYREALQRVKQDLSRKDPDALSNWEDSF